jgi:hypothetical protein
VISPAGLAIDPTWAQFAKIATGTASWCGLQISGSARCMGYWASTRLASPSAEPHRLSHLRIKRATRSRRKPKYWINGRRLVRCLVRARIRSANDIKAATALSRQLGGWLPPGALTKQAGLNLAISRRAPRRSPGLGERRMGTISIVIETHTWYWGHPIPRPSGAPGPRGHFKLRHDPAITTPCQSRGGWTDAGRCRRGRKDTFHDRYSSLCAASFLPATSCLDRVQDMRSPICTRTQYVLSRAARRTYRSRR